MPGLNSKRHARDISSTHTIDHNQVAHTAYQNSEHQLNRSLECMITSDIMVSHQCYCRRYTGHLLNQSNFVSSKNLLASGGNAVMKIVSQGFNRSHRNLTVPTRAHRVSRVQSERMMPNQQHLSPLRHQIRYTLENLAIILERTAKPIPGHSV